MKWLERRKAKKELEHLLFELRQYLSNNYKEPAHKARKRLDERTEELNRQGLLSAKDYEEYRILCDEYARRMENYHH